MILHGFRGSFVKALRFAERIVPRYGAVVLLMMLGVNALTYYATRPLTAGMHRYNWSLPIDAYIPFVPAWIIIYIAAYFQWVVGYIIIARESKEVCFSVLTGEMLAKLLCMVIFLLLPTTMQRATVTENDFCSQLVQLIYTMDRPDNLFPSIHCMESWLCFRGALRVKKAGRLYAPLSFVFALLVFASVVLVKQHVAIDILGGVAVAELGLLLSNKTGIYRIFYRLGRGGKKHYMANATKNNRSKLIWTLLFIVVAAATVWTVTAQNQSFSIQSFLSFLQSAKMGWLIAALLAVFGFIIFEGLALKTACRPFGYKIGVRDCIAYSSADIYFSAITPSATGGQPVCGFFMAKDGIAGITTTAVLLANLVMYTLSIITIGIVMLLIFPGFILRFDSLSKFLMVIGYIAQIGLAAFFLTLIFSKKLLKKICFFTVNLLCKIKILRHREKRLEKLEKQMADYEQCVVILRQQRKMLIKVFALNLLQRSSTILVTVFVYLAAGGEPANALQLFALQSFVIIGSNCVPIPGAMGVSDYLLLQGFGAMGMPAAQAVNMELLSRSLSCYFCVILCGLLVLIKYFVPPRRKYHVGNL